MSNNLKLAELLGFLSEAENLIAKFSGGYSNRFSSAQEFHSALTNSILRLRDGDNDQLNNLSLWFAPTCDWDDFTHRDGEHLANHIFQLATELRKSLNVYSLYDLIKDYQQNVQRVMDAFKEEHNSTDLFAAWLSDKLFPQTGHLKKHNIKHYAFHGIGLAVTFDDDISVDIDFAFLPKLHYDGFDLFRLRKFASAQPNKYAKYLDEKKLEADFNEYIANGVIIKPDTTPSTDLYFFKWSLDHIA